MQSAFPAGEYKWHVSGKFFDIVPIRVTPVSSCECGCCRNRIYLDQKQLQLVMFSCRHWKGRLLPGVPQVVTLNAVKLSKLNSSTPNSVLQQGVKIGLIHQHDNLSSFSSIHFWTVSEVWKWSFAVDWRPWLLSCTTRETFLTSIVNISMSGKDQCFFCVESTGRDDFSTSTPKFNCGGPMLVEFNLWHPCIWER